MQSKEDSYEDGVQRRLNELQVIQGQKIRDLELKVQEREERIINGEEKLKRMEEGFEYNLHLIQQRDADISELTAKLVEIKGVLENKLRQFSALENELLQQRRETEDAKNRERNYQDKLEESKQEVKFYKTAQQEEQLRAREMELKVSSAQTNLKEEQGKQAERLEQMREIMASERTRLEKELEREIARKSDQSGQLADMMKRVSRQNEELTRECQQLKERMSEMERINRMEINERALQLTEAQQMQQQAESELASFKTENSRIERIFKDKQENMFKEKQDLEDKLREIKTKNKLKMKEMKEEMEKRLESILKDISNKERRYQDEIREIQRKYDYSVLSENSLKERLQSQQREWKREQEQSEQRINALLGSLEEDKKSLHSELQLREFKIQQMQQDLESQQRQLKQSNQEVEQVKVQLHKIEQENVLLIQELVLFRKNQKQGELQVDNEEGDSFEKLFSEDMGFVKMSALTNLSKQIPKQNQNQQLASSKPPVTTNVQSLQRLKELEVEINTYKELIESMTREMENAKQKIEYTNGELRLSREECVELRNRVSEQKLDIVSYRERLQRLEENQREMSRELSEKKGLESLKEILVAREEQLAAVKQKSERQGREIINLKRERDSLADISSGLKSKCIELEERLEIFERDHDQGIDPAGMRAQNEVMFEKLRKMEQQLLRGEEELRKWRQFDNDKEKVIEELKQELIQHNRLLKNNSVPALSVLSHYNHMKRQEAQRKNNHSNDTKKKQLPKYSEFQSIEEGEDDEIMKPTADGRKPSPGIKKSGNNSIADDIFKRN